MLKTVLFSLIAIPLGYVLFLIRQTQIREHLNYVGLPQTEINQEGQLLTEDGYLRQIGWARSPMREFNSQVLSNFQRLTRLKRWDYYQVTTEQLYFGIALADLGYTQSVQVTFYDFDNEYFVHKEKILIPFISDTLNLTDNVLLGDEAQELKINSTDFVLLYKGSLKDGMEIRYLNVTFAHKEDIIQVNLRLDNVQKDDRIVTVTPINSKKTQFFYNQKSYNWLAKGTIQVNHDRKFDILQAQSNAGADWGRGIWNYHTFWLWASAQGFLENGQRFGLNLGGGFQDEKASATEEALFINKKLHKLRDLVYLYDLDDLDSPFVIKSHDVERNQFKVIDWEDEEDDKKKEEISKQINSKPLRPGQFYCEFMPVYTNFKNIDLILLHMRFNQVLGVFSGGYVLENGEIIYFNKIFGLMEFNKSKW